MTRYRATQRCVRDDLSLDPSHASRNVEHFCAEHEALRVFLGKRRIDPGKGENVLGVTPYGHVKSLHVGTARAATIYDPELDVCWLLAYSETHAVGEKRDAYKHFERLSGRGELLPSTDDVAALSTLTSASVIDTLRVHGRQAYADALSSPGDEVCSSLTLDDGQDASIVVSIEIVVEVNERAEQGWAAFVVPHDAPVTPELLLDLVADLLPPHIDLDTLEHAGDVNGRTVRYNEVAFTWQHYSST